MLIRSYRSEERKVFRDTIWTGWRWRFGTALKESWFLYLEVSLFCIFDFFFSFLGGQIRKMDLEARSLQPNVKAMLLAKLREYKSDLNKLKREFKRISSPDAHEELLESGKADPNVVHSHFCFDLAWFMVTMFSFRLLVLSWRIDCSTWF